MANRQPLIAVVDDEESVRLALARMLRASSFDVSIYRSGEDFLESLKTVVPDCAVLDFQMPGLTGRDLQRAISVAKLSLPIIIVTAHDQPSLREKVLADGAVAYFTKPLRRDTLIAALQQALHQSVARSP
jgi:FixJ family two-component response regulator